jgi:3-hydroxybutyryl-CoA dehydrogenase
MNIAVIATDKQFEEFVKNKMQINFVKIRIVDLMKSVFSYDALFDFEYENDENRKIILNNLQVPVFINCVTTCKNVGKLICFNGWSSMVQNELWELIVNENEDVHFKNIMEALQIKYVLNSVAVGFVKARVVAMLVNEAYFALQDYVSTKEEIDIAMKLGTNYPYGPFEWSEIIGLKNIYVLLTELALQNDRYQVANGLKNEIKN